MAKPKNRFEPFTDIDIDGAVFQVGLQHCMIGPPRTAMHIGTGAIEITICMHCTDIDSVIDALNTARKKLRKIIPVTMGVKA